MTQWLTGTRSLITVFVAGVVLSAGATIRVESAMPPASASMSTPLCRDANVRASLLGEGDATQNFVYEFALINVGHSSCRLAGYPRVWGIRGGESHRLLITRHGTFAGNLAPTVLAPREVGEVMVSVTDSCNAANLGGQVKIRRLAKANTYDTLAIELPGGGADTSLEVSGIVIDVVCGLDVSQLGWSKTLSP